MSLLVAISLLSVLIVAFLAVPLLRRRPTSAKRADYDIGVYRDQLAELEHDRERGLLSGDQADQAKREIERRLLAADAKRRTGSGFHGSRASTAILLTALPVIPAAAVAVYFVLGQPALPDQPFAARHGAETDMAGGTPPAIADMVARLEERLKSEPNDVEGWAMLGRSYLVLQQFADAKRAYLNAWEVSGDPALLAEAAEVDVIVNDSIVTPDILTVFENLRKSQPYEPKPRYYIGLAKIQSGDARGGIGEWVDLLHLSPADAPWVPTIRQHIAGAASETGIDAGSIQPSEAAVALRDDLGGGLGGPAIPGPTQEDIENAEEMSAEEQLAFIRSMVQRLADRLADNPDDREGWLRLARAYQVLGEDEKAADALERAETAGE